jgi:hypothetical protein
LTSSLFYELQYVAFTGSSANEKYHNKKLVLWDNINKRVISSTQFRDGLINIKVLKNLIFASTSEEINICYFNKEINMIEVKQKIFDCSSKFDIWLYKNNYLLASVDKNNRVKIIEVYEKDFEYHILSTIEPRLTGMQNIFYDEKSEIIFIVDGDGRNIKGYIINSENTLVCELYRGKNPSYVSWVTTINGKHVVVSNSNKTLHIFEMKMNEKNESYLSSFYSLFVNPYKLNKSIMKIRIKDYNKDADFFENDYKHKGNILLYNEKKDQLMCLCYNGKTLIFKIDTVNLKHELIREFSWCSPIEELKNSTYISDDTSLRFSYCNNKQENLNQWKIV